MKVAFTGHRPPKLGMAWDPYSQSNKRVLADMCQGLQDHGATSVISGMALGVDQIAVIAARVMGLPYDAYVPFPGQESRWPQARIDTYHRLMDGARQVIYIARAYSNRAFQKRNEAMVDASDLLLAYWDGSPGGTANCVHYAESIDHPIDQRVTEYKP